MTAHHRVQARAVAMTVLASAAAALAVESRPFSWAVAVTLAVLPGLAIVWLQPHPAPSGLVMSRRPSPWSGHGWS